MSIAGGVLGGGGGQQKDGDNKQGAGEGPDHASEPWHRIEIDLDGGVLVLPEPAAVPSEEPVAPSEDAAEDPRPKDD